MSLFYLLLLYYLALRFIVKSRTRKAYLLTGSIITIAAVLIDIYYLIANPLEYLKSTGWQVILAYVVFLIFTFTNTSSRKAQRVFFKKYNTKTSETFSTGKSRGMYAIITGCIILAIGIGLFLIYILDVYDKIPIISYVGSGVAFIILLVYGIIEINSINEKFILLIVTNDRFYTYFAKVDSKFKFNYMNYIRDIYRYYIIEKLGEFKYKGDIKETHYVWILKTENLNDYDISKFTMEKDNNYWYNEIVDKVYRFRGSKFNIYIKNNKIDSLNRR